MAVRRLIMLTYVAPFCQCRDQVARAAKVDVEAVRIPASSSLRYAYPVWIHQLSLHYSVEYRILCSINKNSWFSLTWNLQARGRIYIGILSFSSQRSCLNGLKIMLNTLLAINDFTLIYFLIPTLLNISVIFGLSNSAVCR